MQNSIVFLLLLFLTSCQVTLFSPRLDDGDFVNKRKGRYDRLQRIVISLDADFFFLSNYVSL